MGLKAYLLTTYYSSHAVQKYKLHVVDSFGRISNKQGSTDSDITARVGKARAAFIIPEKVWSSKEIAMPTKL